MIEPILIGAYAVTNLLRIFAYLPQIASVLRASDRAEAVSLLTWTFWGLANITTTAYSALILQDFLTMAVFFGNSVCCALVVSIVVWKRRRYSAVRTARTPRTARYRAVVRYVAMSREFVARGLAFLRATARPIPACLIDSLRPSQPTTKERPLLEDRWRAQAQEELK